MQRKYLDNSNYNIVQLSILGYQTEKKVIIYSRQRWGCHLPIRCSTLGSPPGGSYMIQFGNLNILYFEIFQHFLILQSQAPSPLVEPSWRPSAIVARSARSSLTQATSAWIGFPYQYTTYIGEDTHLNPLLLVFQHWANVCEGKLVNAVFLPPTQNCSLRL